MDLKIKYLGKTLSSPLVVSASPLSDSIDNIKKMEDAGAAAVVLYSVFEEQIIHDQREIHYQTTVGTDSFAEALSYFPEPDDYRLGPEEYLEHIRKAKAAVSMPIIASLNGSSIGGWTSYAKKMEDAGADAIELNIYFIPTDMNMSGADLESQYVEVLKAVKAAVNVPVALKVSPYFSNFANMAKRFDEAGADSLVLFNRFYQPDIDLEELEVVPNIMLSQSAAMRLPLRWIALLKDRVRADLAATSGIHSGLDAIKMVMVGANVVCLNSVLLKHGIDQIATIKNQMVDWMTAKEYESIAQMHGSMSQLKTGNPAAYERAQYLKALTTYKVEL